MGNLIQGSKRGGGGGHTPTELPDSLLSESTAKILLAISEGEIAGGLDDTRIFLDGTPIGNNDGTKNFEGVTWEFRPGSEVQEYIKGIPSVDNEINIDRELRDDQPYIRAISNTQLSAERVRFSLPRFMQMHDNGDKTGYCVDYAIDLSTDGAGYKEVLASAFDGKTTNEYHRTHRIDLPKADTGWQLRVRRLTKNQNNLNIVDKVNISAVADVIDAKLRYPNTALLFITFNARQFNNRIPKISIRPKGGLVIKVPTNYDPINRTYTDVWNGTFKMAATNNPAWVFYDLVLNNRYGCGDRINPAQVDKWGLYRVAQYCDQLVPDGRGGEGKEPRFLCDVYIQSQESAYQVLRDIAGIFRGMTYWADNTVKVVADMPSDVFRVFTNASIAGGIPEYAGGSHQNRYTQALVSYSDTSNHSNDAIEAVSDLKLQRRYNVRKTDISAIGCTRQTEANRRGRWALLTNSQDRTITFATGLEGAVPNPGHIIGIADATLAGRDIGGRISIADGRKVTLDRVADVKAGDRLIINLPDGKSEARTVQLVNEKTIIVTTAYSQRIEKNAVWTIDADDLAIQLYRVINVSDNGNNTYTITAVYHDPDKYDRIDTGARIDERPISVIPPGIQSPPKNITISSDSSVHQGMAVTTLRVTWEAVENAIAYEAEWRRDNGNWISAPRTSTQSFEVPNIYAGRYQARVRAINAAEISSLWANATETHLRGKEGNPPAPLAFRTTPIIFGIQLDWGFAAHTSDTLKTEIQYSQTNDGEGLMLLADIPYPQRTHTMQGLAAGVAFYFRARLVDKSGNPSPWTAFIRGESSSDTRWITDAAGNQFMTTEAGKRLAADIDWNAESVLMLSNEQQKLSKELLVRDGENKAQIQELWSVRVTDKEAAAQRMTEVNAEIGENTSRIKSVETTIAGKDRTYGQQFTEIRTNLGNMAADVITNKQAISTAQKAQAKKMEQVQAQLGDQQAMINSKMQAEFDQSGSGYAMHSTNIILKYNGQKYTAGGMVISGEIKGGKLESYIGFSANNFAFFNPVNGKPTPFMTVKNGQMFINSLFVDMANIQQLLVGIDIKSTNYIPNQQGFRFDAQTGAIEINGVSNEYRIMISNRGFYLFDKTNTPIIELGELL
ncbi:host specificity protein J [Xenorhabdus koppenhoeferi]|uniref:Phage-related protein, tail component n=1 Tax=Xenorhabdus koppenhoeferi TaxID=351659 RepID=A0A1I7G6N9_9GAMM|nr:phage tail protein [Xenorhabdus koppenhoeferi]SFU44088.1 Phage-related protein, tail component [Xenorhabdus koppenhoeferi]